MPGDLSWMQARYDELAERSLLWEPPTLEGPSVPRCRMDGKPTIMLSANNYLNLTTHPKVVDAAVEATKTYGAGSGSVRAIAGTMDLHLEAEKEVAAFKRAEAALIYSAGYTANVGLIKPRPWFGGPDHQRRVEPRFDHRRRSPHEGQSCGVCAQ